MDILNLGIDESILKELQAGNNGYDKGVEVTHQLKDKLNELLPFEYVVRGVITGKIEKVRNELKITNEKQFTGLEYQERNRAHYYFLRNLTQLRDVGKGNPYDNFLKVERLEKEEEKYELEDGRVILLISKQIDLFKKVKIDMTKVIVDKYIPRDFKNSTTEEKLDGISDEELEQLIGEESEGNGEIGL